MIRNYQLRDLIAESMGKSVEWGVDDCVLFAGLASELITGRNPFQSMLGAWSSKREAYVVIARLGDSLPDAMSKWAPQNGLREIDPECAVEGDVGILQEAGLPSMSCRIAQGWLVRAERGFGLRPAVERAWGWA